MESYESIVNELTKAHEQFKREWPGGSYTNHSPEFDNACIAFQAKQVLAFTKIAHRRFIDKPTDTFIWMTINFKSEPDLTLANILGSLQKLAQRSFMTEYWYNVEQRSTDPSEFYGFHSHWIVKTKHPFGQFKRDVLNTLKNFVGNPNAVHLQRCPLSWFQDKIEYLSGIKWDEEKKDKVAADKIFREKYFLKDIYTNEKTSRSPQN